MRLAYCPPEPCFIAWHGNQVNVIGHQTVGPDVHSGANGLLGKQVAIDLLIAVLEEDRLATIAALRNVMRQARNNDAAQACHAPMIGPARSQESGCDSRSAGKTVKLYSGWPCRDRLRDSVSCRRISTQIRNARMLTFHRGVSSARCSGFFAHGIPVLWNAAARIAFTVEHSGAER